MCFHDVRFPTDLSFGALGGPERLSQVVMLASGYEERNTPWEHSRRRYDAGMGLRHLDDLDVLIAFFEARRGRVFGFRWKDWSDFSSAPGGGAPDAADQEIALGDEVTTAFQLTKRYRSGDVTYQRPIMLPVEGSVQVGLGDVPVTQNVDYSIDHRTGVITFNEPPGIDVQITAGFEFDVPVRFDTDHLQVALSTYNAGQVPNVPVVEIRL